MEMSSSPRCWIKNLRFTEVHTGGRFPGSNPRAGVLSTGEEEIRVTGGATGKTVGGLPDKDVGCWEAFWAPPLPKGAGLSSSNTSVPISPGLGSSAANSQALYLLTWPHESRSSPGPTRIGPLSPGLLGGGCCPPTKPQVSTSALGAISLGGGI